MKVRVNKENFQNGVPTHWAGSSALQSHVLNTLSLMFPDGERFFVRAVKRFADQIDDAKLKNDVKIFIGQEMQHGLAHERFNAVMTGGIAGMDWFMWLFTKPTFAVLEPMAEKIGTHSLKALALSVTAAAENMTAGFAEMLFSGDTLAQIKSDEIRELMSWHAAEEIEHRDLAFDLLQKVEGSYAMRIAGMAVAYPIIFGYVVLGTAYLLTQDKQFSWLDLPREAVDIFVKENRLGRVFIEGLIAYLRPDFHPSDVPAHPAAQAYLNRLAS